MNPSREFLPGLVIRGFTPPLQLADFKLVAFDMDSTLINIECIDEIADAVGKKAEVAAITEATMRGEIKDFKESLRRRVSLLQGVPVGALQQVYVERLRLNPGAEELVRACKAAGLKVLLVSGGFTFFANRVKARLGIDFARSNLLDEADGHLTGGVAMQSWGDICDGAEKRRTLLEVASLLGISAGQTIAVGDGANDSADDGRGRPFGGLSRQTRRAGTGHGRHQAGRAGQAPRSPALNRYSRNRFLPIAKRRPHVIGLSSVSRPAPGVIQCPSTRRRQHEAPPFPRCHGCSRCRRDFSGARLRGLARSDRSR